MNHICRPRLDEETYASLKLWQSYIKKRTGHSISIGKTIRWLVTHKLTLKDTA